MKGNCCNHAGYDDIRSTQTVEQALRNTEVEDASTVHKLSSDDEVINRVLIEREFILAMERNEFILEYQPKVHVRRQEICGVEALVRWQHPVLGRVFPNKFIPLAEVSHKIVALTLWTLRQAVHDQRVLEAAGHSITVFINVSGALLNDTKFINEACGIIKQNKACIGFEVTETAVIRDPEGAIVNLNTLTAIGVAISIDDYGAGLSSLAYLKQLPACELKIDKLFITKLTSAHRDPLIVRSTIDLAHALEMEVVAEGVETSATLALLSVMGCDIIQGYFISKPVPLSKLIIFMNEFTPLILDRSIKSPLKLMSGGLLTK